MPIKQSAKKALRKAAKRTESNLRIKQNVKALYKLTKEAIEKNDMTKARELSHAFQQIVDKAAQKRAVSKNAAKRKKSKLMTAIHAASK